MGGHLRAERHLDTRPIAHRGVQHRFSNRDVLPGPLREFGNKRVEFRRVVVEKVRLHRFVCGVVDEDWAVHAVARDILDVLVVHHRVDQSVAEELLLHVIQNLLPPHRIKMDPVIGDDSVCRVAKRFACRLACEVTGGDIERLKETLLDLQEEFPLRRREFRLKHTVGVLMGCAVVDDPDVGVWFVYRVEFDLFHSRGGAH